MRKPDAPMGRYFFMREIVSRVQPLRIMFAAFLTGIVIGLVANATKLAIACITDIATTTFSFEHSDWWRLLLGIAAIMLSGIIVRKVVKMPLEHSTSRLKQDLSAGRVPLSGKLTIAPVAINALTLGLGGSAGAEGPIAYTGGAIATRIARLFGLSEEQMLTFLACGAGAGIAAIFKSPLGGVFFTLEVLRYSLNVSSVLMLVVMCLTSGLSACAFNGFTVEMFFVCHRPFELQWYLPTILLGLWCGVYSLYYIWSGKMTAQILNNIDRPWMRNLAAGTILGICLILVPSLYGEGYGILTNLLDGNLDAVTNGTLFDVFDGLPSVAVIALVGILLLKGIACYATNSGGGVAGEFAPTIFAGGIAGALFVITASTIPGWEDIPSGYFIILAMSAVMSASIKAPLMAIFIISEMTMTSSLLLPMCVASGVSYAVSSPGKFSKIKG